MNPANDHAARTVLCNCLALRQAARHVTQLYDGSLAPFGLRTTQFSILARLQRGGSRALHALAEDMVLDRTTLGRNIKPLERDGLLAIRPDPDDRRSRILAITPKGAELVGRAMPAWGAAQARFEQGFGAERAALLRRTLAELSSADF
jgi:DNA-binding MarR family transcriptional regulator